MTLYKNKYRIESTRLPHHDYAANGWYFVTICTKDKLDFFGNINAGCIHFSPIVEIAYQFWLEIPQHFKYIDIDSFIIMPNHVHGIVVINHSQCSRDVACNVSTTLEQWKNDDHTISRIMSNFSPKAGSLSVIIRSYKAAVTSWSRKNGYDNFAWQPRFYDHIIRDEQALANIQEYIINNPAKWHEDQDNPANLWM